VNRTRTIVEPASPASGPFLGTCSVAESRIYRFRATHVGRLGSRLKTTRGVGRREEKALKYDGRAPRGPLPAKALMKPDGQIRSGTPLNRTDEKSDEITDSYPAALDRCCTLSCSHPQRPQASSVHASTTYRKLGRGHANQRRGERPFRFAKQTQVGHRATSAKCRFCCKSQLRQTAKRDSVVLTRCSARSIHDGPSEE
jgi:hypothetical protein